MQGRHGRRVARQVVLPHNRPMKTMRLDKTVWKSSSAAPGVTRGFSLIELMITIVIVAILASIAYPSYQNYILKSRRADAMVALQRIQLEQEKFRAGCTQYASKLEGTRTCDATVTTNPFVLGLPTSQSDNGYYNIEPESVTATGYTLKATAIGNQARDTTCATMSIVVSGLSVTTTATNSSCWVK